MRAMLTRTSPFKSLVESGKVPGTLHSPDLSEDEGHSFEDDTVVPSKYMDEATKIGAGLARKRRLVVVLVIRHGLSCGAFGCPLYCRRPSDSA